VSSTILNVFNCLQVEGKDYLVRDVSVLCYDDQWTSYAACAAIFTLLFPVGIPAFYLYILRRHRSTLNESATLLQLGFLYEAYTEVNWYWELIDMLHKLLVTSVVSFLPNYMELPGVIILLTLYLCLLLIIHPYIRKGDDRLHLLAQAELLNVSIMGLVVLNSPDSMTELTDVLLSILLIVVVIGLCVVFLGQSGKNLQKIWQHHKRKKLHLANPAMQQMAVSESTVVRSGQDSEEQQQQEDTQEETQQQESQENA